MNMALFQPEHGHIGCEMDKHFTTIENVRNSINRFKQENPGLSWNQVGKHFGLTRATAWKIVNVGYEPKDAKTRIVLNLPPYVEVEACPVCGVVHVRKCPKETKPKRAIPVEEKRARAIINIVSAIRRYDLTLDDVKEMMKK